LPRPKKEKINLLLPHSRQWKKFINLLSGPDGCNFREKTKGKADYVWNCNNSAQRPFTRKILKQMGYAPAAIKETLAYCDNHGGHCDCEVVFNCGGE
jgi:hypothetical protein